MASGFPLKILSTGELLARREDGALVPAADRGVYVCARRVSAGAYDPALDVLVDVFQDSALTTSLPQPIVTDSDGALPGFVMAERALDLVDAITGERVEAEPLAVGDLVGEDGKIGGPGTLGLTSSVVPGAAFYDVVGHSISGGGGVTNGLWNGYVDKAAFLLGSPRRKRDLSIGGAVSCLPSCQNTTGDGGFGHVLGFLPIPPTVSAGGPFLPQADIAVCHLALNDLALLGASNSTPMQEAHRTIIARLVAAAVAQSTDTSLTFTGTWGGATYTAGQTSPAGIRTTTTVGDTVSWAVPQISFDAGNRYVDWTINVHPTDDFVIGVSIDGTAQPDVHIQGSAMCAQAGFNGAGAQNNAITRRYLVNGTATHTIVLTLKSAITGGLRFDSGTIESDSVDGPIIVVPNNHRCYSYSLWGAAWPNGAGMGDGAIATWNTALASVVGEFPHALLVDIDSALNKDQAFFMPSATNDGAHPNDVGHGVIAKTIFDALVASGKLLSRQFSRVSPQAGSDYWIPVGQNINSYPQFQNSWVNNGGTYPPVGYNRDFQGRVRIRGGVKNTSGPGSVIFNMPVGWRPAYTASHSAWGSTTVPGLLQVNPSTGAVQMAAGGAIALSVLDGMQYQAAQ